MSQLRPSMVTRYRITFVTIVFILDISFCTWGLYNWNMLLLHFRHWFHLKLLQKMIACSIHVIFIKCKECVDWFSLITFTYYYVFDSNCQIERDLHHIRPDAADKFSANWPSLVRKLLPRLLLEKDSKARKIISQLTDNLTIGTG